MMTLNKITRQRQWGHLAVQIGKIQQSLRSNQSGFTIVESLIAMIVIAILMTAIAPVVVLSVATRVQSRRVELATQAARTYIDGVRVGTIPPPNHTIPLNEVDPTSNSFTPKRWDVFAAVPAPTTGAGSLSTCPTTAGNQYCQNSLTPSTTTPSLYCIDIDGGGCSNSNTSKDFIVQAFRGYNSTANPTADPNQGYLLGVRVYRVDGFSDSSSLFNTKQTYTDPDKPFTRQSTFTSRLGYRKAPLVEMTTEIVTPNKTNYGNLCSRLSCK